MATIITTNKASIPTSSVNPAPVVVDNNTNRMLQLTFADFEDLTTRLVLLPRIEDEGIGAVVASYVAAADAQTGPLKVKIVDDDAPEDSSSNDSTNQHQQLITTTESRDEEEDCPEKNVFNPTENPTTTTTTTPSIDSSLIIGSVLVGTSTSSKAEDWRDTDFATILAVLRGQPGPIELELEVDNTIEPMETDPNHHNNNKVLLEDDTSLISVSNSMESSSSSATTASSSDEKKELDTAPLATPQAAPSTSTATPNSENSNRNADMAARFSRWGSRMRVQAQMAAESASVASSAAVLSMQTAAANRTVQGQKVHADNQRQNQENACCGIYVQTSLGPFLPLINNTNMQQPSSSSSSSSALTITISSVLYIRKSVVEACPSRGFSYQWYKGGIFSNAADNNGDNNGGDDDDDGDDSRKNQDPDWIILDGATSAAFQPSTTEVGFKLMCLVTMEISDIDDDNSDSSESNSDSSDQDDGETNNGKQRGKTITTLQCFTPQVVAADLALFNGARKALQGGALFGGYTGQGRVQGRSLQILVEMGTTETNSNKNQNSARVRIEQVSGERGSGDTAEPLHEGFFPYITANSTHDSPKNVQLQFRAKDLEESASLLSALASDDGILELVAPNRFARESLLLAIGIANFTGKPSNLDVTTILYPTVSQQHQLCESEAGGIDESSTTTSCDSECDNASTAFLSASPTLETQQEHLMPSTVASAEVPQREVVGKVVKIVEEGVKAAIEAGSNASLSSIPAQDLPSQNNPQSTRDMQEQTKRESALKDELAFLRAKLSRKDKVVSELQCQVAHLDGTLGSANQQVSKLQQEAGKVDLEFRSSQRLQKAAENMADQHVATLNKRKSDHDSEVSALTQKIKSQAIKIAEFEKLAESRGNEKAVLAAAVERKSDKMAELQELYAGLTLKVSQQEQWRKELDESTRQYQDLKVDLQKAAQVGEKWRGEVESTKAIIESSTKEFEAAKDLSKVSQEELKVVRAKNQKLKSERNSYKQKADSLAKEIACICRNGRTLADIERFLAEEEARTEEVKLLRKQKRKVLEECHAYRKSYEHSKAAQELMLQSHASPKKNTGYDPNSSFLLLERNVELERLVSELTEYVNAKEMQLETMKQVHSALQDEIRELARANMNKDEV